MTSNTTTATSFASVGTAISSEESHFLPRGIPGGAKTGRVETEAELAMRDDDNDGVLGVDAAEYRTSVAVAPPNGETASRGGAATSPVSIADNPFPLRSKSWERPVDRPSVAVVSSAAVVYNDDDNDDDTREGGEEDSRGIVGATIVFSPSRDSSSVESNLPRSSWIHHCRGDMDVTPIKSNVSTEEEGSVEVVYPVEATKFASSARLVVSSLDDRSTTEYELLDGISSRGSVKVEDLSDEGEDQRVANFPGEVGVIVAEDILDEAPGAGAGEEGVVRNISDDKCGARNDSDNGEGCNRSNGRECERGGASLSDVSAALEIFLSRVPDPEESAIPGGGTPPDEQDPKQESLDTVASGQTSFSPLARDFLFGRDAVQGVASCSGGKRSDDDGDDPPSDERDAVLDQNAGGGVPPGGGTPPDEQDPKRESLDTVSSGRTSFSPLTRGLLFGRDAVQGVASCSVGKKSDDDGDDPPSDEREADLEHNAGGGVLPGGGTPPDEQDPNRESLDTVSSGQTFNTPLTLGLLFGIDAVQGVASCSGEKKSGDDGDDPPSDNRDVDRWQNASDGVAEEGPLRMRKKIGRTSFSPLSRNLLFEAQALGGVASSSGGDGKHDQPYHLDNECIDLSKSFEREETREDEDSSEQKKQEGINNDDDDTIAIIRETFRHDSASFLSVGETLLNCDESPHSDDGPNSTARRFPRLPAVSEHAASSVVASSVVGLLYILICSFISKSSMTINENGNIQEEELEFCHITADRTVVSASLSELLLQVLTTPFSDVKEIGEVYAFDAEDFELKLFGNFSPTLSFLSLYAFVTTGIAFIWIHRDEFKCAPLVAPPSKLSKSPRKRILDHQLTTLRFGSTPGKGVWTKEEHEQFVQGCNEHGNKWTEVTKHIPTRTYVQVSNRGCHFVKKATPVKRKGRAVIVASAPATC